MGPDARSSGLLDQAIEPIIVDPAGTNLASPPVQQTLRLTPRPRSSG